MLRDTKTIACAVSLAAANFPTSAAAKPDPWQPREVHEPSQTEAGHNPVDPAIRAECLSDPYKQRTSTATMVVLKTWMKKEDDSKLYACVDAPAADRSNLLISFRMQNALGQWGYYGDIGGGQCGNSDIAGYTYCTDTRFVIVMRNVRICSVDFPTKHSEGPDQIGCSLS